MTASRSRLTHEHLGPDRIWRGTWVTPAGYLIHARLDMGATERLARLKAGIDEPGPNGAPLLPEWLINLWTWLVGVTPARRDGL